MINKVQVGTDTGLKKHVNQHKQTGQILPPFFNGINAETVKLDQLNLNHLQANFLTFKGSKGPTNKIFDTSKVDQIIPTFDDKLKDCWNKAIQVAISSQSKELDTSHLMKVMIGESKTFFIGIEKNRNALSDMIVGSTEDVLRANGSFSKLNRDLVPFYQFISNKIDSLKDLSKGYKGPVKVSDDLVQILKKSISEDGQITSESKFFRNVLDAKNPLGEGVKDHVIQLQQKTLQYMGGQKVMPKKENSKIEIKSDNESKEVPVLFNAIQKHLTPKNNYGEKMIPDSNNPLEPTDHKTLTVQPDNKLMNFEYFENKAKTIGAVVSGGKNAIYTHQNGAEPELLAHSFTKLVNEGKLQDITKQNTEVELIDTHQYLSDGHCPVSDLEKVVNSNRKHGKQSVVFIKGFDKFFTYLDNLAQKNYKYDQPVFFKTNVLGPDVRIIGFMDGTMYNALTDTSSPMARPDVIERKQTLETCFEKFSLGAPSPDKTKEMILQEPRLLAPITMKYEQDIIFEPEAVSKAVDLAVKIRKGAMPGKAIDLLNFVTGIKSNATGNEFASITVDDVEKLAQLYPELKQPPESEGTKFTVLHNTGISMKDVGGASQAKEVVDEILDFLKEPEKFTKLGAKMPKGVLLHGTPGNGKTHLAKAIAGEAGVPFISVSGSQFVEKYVGVGASRVRELFDFARDQARGNEQRTAIIFVDEFDAVGRARGGGGDGGNREAEQTLNELLVQMDGLSNNSDVNVVVLAATNRPDLLDTALTERPGRFDHKIEVPNPANDPQARYEILQVHTKGKKLAAKNEEEKEAMLRELADKTSGASGARLADIINKAAMIAARDNRDAIALNDLIEAKLESSYGRINKNHKEPMWSKEQTVAHECGHALIMQTFLDIAKQEWHKGEEIDTITLDPRGEFLGAVLQKPGENTTINTFERVFGNLTCSYGGYSVEKLLYGMEGSSGVVGDLQQATGVAMKAVTQMGMGPNSRLLSAGDNQFVRDIMKDQIKADMVLFTNQAAKVSDMLVKFHKPFIEQYTNNYKVNAGKGGNNLSGEAFQKELHEWRNAPERKEAFQKLQKQIYKIMKDTQAGKVKA